MSLVVDSMFSTPLLVRALAAFQGEFPSVTLRIYVESLGATAQAVLDGRADLGICLDFAAAIPELEITVMGEVELVPVAAPTHPLALLEGRLEPEQIRDHVQSLVCWASSRTWPAIAVLLGAPGNRCQAISRRAH